ncbi:hypothetical protein BDV10DRAFT_67659 [Aspergillus recurvatus]
MAGQTAIESYAPYVVGWIQGSRHWVRRYLDHFMALSRGKGMDGSVLGDATLANETERRGQRYQLLYHFVVPACLASAPGGGLRNSKTDRAEIIGGTSIVYRGSTDACARMPGPGTAALHTVLLSEFCRGTSGVFWPWYQMRIRQFCDMLSNERASSVPLREVPQQQLLVVAMETSITAVPHPSIQCQPRRCKLMIGRLRIECPVVLDNPSWGREHKPGNTRHFQNIA